MAKKLSKTGISTSSTIQAWHVSQSVDALASPNADAYDISMSGSLSVTGSISGDGSNLTNVAAEKVIELVKNTTGTVKTKTTPIHFSGSSDGTVTFVTCDADIPATMPCHGILLEDIADESTGNALVIGEISGINTNAFDVGSTIYVAGGGGYTATKPTGSALIQNIGTTKVKDLSNGSAEIFGAGRTNDIPNITPGYFWVGNTDSVPVAVATSSIGGGSPGGSNTQVQFNNEGAFDGAAAVTYDPDLEVLTVDHLNSTAITASGAISSSYNGTNNFAGNIALDNNRNIGGDNTSGTGARPLVLRNTDNETQLGSVHYPIRIANDITGSIAVTGSIDVAFESGSSHKSFRVMGTHSVPAWTVGTTIDFYVDEYIRLHWDGTADFEAEILTDPSSNDVHIVYNNDGTYTFLDRQNSDGQFIIDTSFTSDEIGIATFRAPDDDTWPYYKVTLVQGSGLSYTKTMYAIVEKLVNE